MALYRLVNGSITRRDFLKQTSILTVALTTLGSATAVRAAKSPNEKVSVGVIGCNGRGMAHIAGYLSVPNAEIAYICDVDGRTLGKGPQYNQNRQEFGACCGQECPRSGRGFHAVPS